MNASLTTYPSLLRRLTLLDYPLPLKIHAYLLLGLGCGLTLAPALVITNPLFSYTSRLIGVSPEVPTNPVIKDNSKALSKTISPAQKRSFTTVGLLAIGLGLSYVGTSAFVARPEDNQLLYAAVPLRFAMSLTALVTWIRDKESRSLFSATVLVEDLLGACWLTWWMWDWPLWAEFRP